MLGQKITLGAAGNAGSDSYWYFQFESTTVNTYNYAVTTDGSNNIYPAGEVYDSYYNWSSLISKLDTDGNLVAKKMLATVYVDNFRGAAWDGSNHIYCVGHTGATSSGYYGGLIVKMDLDLNTVWHKYVDAPSAQMCYTAVDVDSSGQPVVGGWSGYHGFGGREIWLEKYDVNGNNVWQRTYGSSHDQEITGVSLNSSNEPYWSGWNNTGAVNSGGSANEGEWGKANVNGSPVFYNYIGDNQLDRAFAIAHDTRDYAYVVGQFNNTSTGTYESFIMQFDQNNSFVNQKAIGASGVTYYAVGVATDSQNNVYVLTRAYNSATYEAMVTKYDSTLTHQWDRTLLANSANTYPEKITVDSNDNVIIVGYSQAYGGTNNSYVCKLPSDGSVVGTFTAGGYNIWVRNPNGIIHSSPNLSVGNLGYSTASHSNNLSVISGGITNTNVTSVPNTNLHPFE